MNFLEYEESHRKDNAIEAMEIDPISSKRRHGPEIKVEEERERPSRNPGK
jgi:hypothetical protein